ncbi:ferredoxin reductase family protein [Leptospira sarikeiensis]|uniref:Iron reductase n=1 Tax=Leptospira sarikeiensis TaxID=2484943 RepID=A0A4R9KB84_9LEPT|nr:ferric reductase-like transmembrane domain-containing protein [Leptospira sarikeiensis]TGL62074.1 iron reductase [Leptospira sarikeiensis]
MSAKKWVLFSVFLGCLIFSLSPGPIHLIQNPTVWELREQLVFLTGACAMSLMVLSMLISVRFEPVNRVMGGLDKAYEIHKWVGIFSFVFIISHWLLEEGAHWLVDLEWIPNPGDLSDGTGFSELEISLFQAGVLFAEIIFYMMIILIGIALINKIPYRFFRVTHKVFPGLFLLLAFHAGTAQMKEHWLSSPGGYLLLILLSIGSVAAVIGLFQKIGNSKRMKGIIDSISIQGEILDLRLKTQDKVLSYKAGQYAFLKFEHDKEPHPFTISSYEENSDTLRFSIKGLGDYTKELKTKIQKGQSVRIEGPYGEFLFEDDSEKQIWIAGGIGITPFMARLEYFSNRGGASKPIDFWYCTRGSLDLQFPSSLDKICKNNSVNLYHLNSDQGEYLSLDLLREKMRNFGDLSIWFCGPKKFREYLIEGLKDYKFDLSKFHYDSFNMR